MSFGAKPKAGHPKLTINELGLTRRAYEGPVSTLCAGCGHDAISAAVVEACFRLSLPAHHIVKMSGIGCSSKTPTYFLNKAHGFNTVHGRMPSVATGAALANRQLCYVGVSGDGDSASIGLGQLCHVIRRRLNMVYIVENNGTYGLTKGQFSATNDRSSKSRRGEASPFDSFDLCALGIQMGAGMVARGFSGDREQLVPLLEAAFRYEGFALLDIISPCVTFNNHAESTKSFDYVREHAQSVTAPDLVPTRDEIRHASVPGREAEVQMHDGTSRRFQRLEEDYDPGDAKQALVRLREAQETGRVLTGLIYLQSDSDDLHQALRTPAQALNGLSEQDLSPDAAALEAINASLR